MIFYEQVSPFTAAECETGWVALNNSCYLVVQEVLHYADAKSACEMKAGTLISAGDADEDNFMKQMCVKYLL